jgi:hypothetical protein
MCVPGLARAHDGALEHEPVAMPAVMAMGPFSSQTPADCVPGQAWDPSVSFCASLPVPSSRSWSLMLHGNLFATRIWESGARGRDAWAMPDHVMLTATRQVSDSNALGLELMATGEKWLFPESGYPELLQTGERDERGRPYIDAQHPHSSPIMALSLSDTIRLDPEDSMSRDLLRLYFAPRGQSTDGPVAFMHRVTGMLNPDAPLGHHIGQDVGHITSTVIGGELRLGGTVIEASAFHGEEPSPEKVDLPLGSIDSGALRLTRELGPVWTGMASLAYVGHPEADEPEITHRIRYSASLYSRASLGTGWIWHNTLIYGGLASFGASSFRNSFAEEFAFFHGHSIPWARLELLERSAGDLAIQGPAQEDSRWVGAVTLGYTHELAELGPVDLFLGGSVTHDLLPALFESAYGGDPWAGKVFLQLSGMRMWGAMGVMHHSHPAREPMPEMPGM